MNIISLHGRQPELSLAELEQRFGSANTTPFSHDAAIIETDSFDVQTLGGSIKAGKVIAELEYANWPSLSRDIVQRYAKTLRGEGKLTLGISIYGKDISPRDVQRTGLALKQTLKKQGRSVRLIPNEASALSTATSHHNKLGLANNKLELIIVYGRRSVIVAESVGTQNITALARRDQERPKRDAFVGMLPPKLALMMINLSGIAEMRNSSTAELPTILDPFCGTGVVLQEASLLGFNTYGTDLSEKMVDYSTINMQWLADKYKINSAVIEQGDATDHTWKQPLSAVIAETYLGQPFSAPPAPDKLEKVRRIVDDITEKFLKNLAEQTTPGTPLCLAVPAWRSSTGWFTFLSTVKKIESLGYEWQKLEHVDSKKLIYYREDQVVARQLLLLRRV